MLGYRINEKKGRLPMQFKERGLWRDFDSLLPDGSHLAPAVIEHAAALARMNRERFPRSVLVLGQSNDNAKVEYWRIERFALPTALLGRDSVRTEIHDMLTDAEKAGTVLEFGMRDTAKLIIARGERKLEPDKWASGKWVPGDVSKFIGKQSADGNPMAMARYWSDLEARFHEILDEYTLDRDPDDIRCSWLTSVRDALRAAWDQHRTSISTGDAWAIRAVVRAEGPILRKIKELDEEIAKLNP
jgi:CRISPR system Cascade subunit CasA